jgi:uncharacterized membrane protein
MKHSVPPPKGTVEQAIDPASKSVLAKLSEPSPSDQSIHLGSRLRNYFLTGLLVVGPITITLYALNWFIGFVDSRVKPFVPKAYDPDTYLPFPVPGIGLVFAIVGLIVIGALAANLLGRTLISYGDLFLGRMPIVRNVYRAAQQIFESVVSAAGPTANFQKVGLIEFPSKGIWSLVFVTGGTTGEIAAVKPGGEEDLVTVFMPTGIVPPHGYVCFLPRKNVRFLNMSIEDAAKIVISAGMVTPDAQKKLAEMAAVAAKAKAKGNIPPIATPAA